MFTNYYYLSSVNLELDKHFEKLSKTIHKNCFVIDIGSNDGIFLKYLKKRRIKFLGIDPSKNVGKIANDKVYKTLIDFFNIKTVNKILKKYGKPDVIVASSIMTHIEKPIEFAKNIKKLLKENGLFIRDIQYLLNLLNNKVYERFYFDRPFTTLLNRLRLFLIK